LLERARIGTPPDSYAALDTKFSKTMRFTAGKHPLGDTRQWNAYLQTKAASSNNVAVGPVGN